jgi:hypothetical protein
MAARIPTTVKNAASNPKSFADQPRRLDPAIQSSLYRHIKFNKIITFNEVTPGSGKAIIKKTWDERLDTASTLESVADE